jgi:hypothetical protein
MPADGEWVMEPGEWFLEIPLYFQIPGGASSTLLPDGSRR